MIFVVYLLKNLCGHNAVRDHFEAKKRLDDIGYPSAKEDVEKIECRIN
jgi:hypothetical protein